MYLRSVCPHSDRSELEQGFLVKEKDRTSNECIVYDPRRITAKVFGWTTQIAAGSIPVPIAMTSAAYCGSSTSGAPLSMECDTENT